MKVSDVKPGSRRIELELNVVETEEPRAYVSRDGKEGKVMTAVGEDETGKIKVSIWGDDIDKVKTGSKIKISNGYARLFRNEVHVSAGLYGKLEVVS